VSKTCGHAVAKFSLGYMRSGVSCPMQVDLTVAIHAAALGLINRKTTGIWSYERS